MLWNLDPLPMRTQTLVGRLQDRTAWSLLPWAVGIALYIGINAAVLLLVSPTANFDQAEVLLLNQTLSLGYAAQPPLYVWLNGPLDLWLGPSLGLNIALKCALLAATLVVSLLTLRDLGGTRKQAALLLAAFGLIPAIVWESQRVLTHTTLAALMVALATRQALRLLRDGSLRNYLLLGLLAGLALLSKYNALLSLAALAIGMLLARSARPLVLRPAALLVPGTAFAVMLPHLWWLLSHRAAVQPTLDKLERAPNGWVHGLAEYGGAVASFVGPLLLVAVLSFGWRRLRARIATAAPGDEPAAAAARSILRTQLLVAALFGVLFVVGTNARHFEERWLVPMFITLPLWVSLSARGLEGPMGFVRTAAVVALLVAVILPARVLLAERLARSTPPVVSAPYLQLAAQMRERHGEPAAIIADTLTAGGNLRLAMPGVAVSVPGTTVLALPAAGAVWLVCENSPCDTQRFSAYGPQALAPQGWETYEAHYLYHERRSHRLQLKVLAR
jgi:4-amino-4-deoxy-L-arabinose transferase-like glycosyltransferase